jgi:hypothetical protein
MFRGQQVTDHPDSVSRPTADHRDARAIARRNRDACGTRLSPVMKTAATACEVAETPLPSRHVAPRGETD